MRRLIRSIAGHACLRLSLPTLVGVEPEPGQLKLRRSAQAELVTCDYAIDITYIRLRAGWLYLVAVLDWFSRYVLAWELDQTLEIDFVLEVVDRALAVATPEIWNSDQGSHFTSPQYIDRLLARDVRVSMDGKDRALDNIFTERLWRTVKYEHVYLSDYDTPRAARLGLTRYLEFYDLDRPHQALGYRTPAEVYFDPTLVRSRRLVGAEPKLVGSVVDGLGTACG